MKKSRYALLFSFLMALVGCSPCPEQNLPSVYIGVQANTEEDVALAKDFLYQAYKESKGGNTFHVDLLQGDTTVRLLSKADIDRSVIVDTANRISETQSTDLAITSFFERLKDLSEYKSENEELHAYFIGTGTSGETTLTDISEILKAVDDGTSQADTNIYLIGVSAENRLKMSDALNPIRESVRSSSRDYSEWKDLVTQYNADYCSQEE